MGGECKRVNVVVVLGYSEKVPTATGKRSYLDPNSQTMQKRGRGVGQSRSVEAESKEARTYLESNRNTMQKPIGGSIVLAFSGVKSMLKNSRGIGVDEEAVELPSLTDSFVRGINRNKLRCNSQITECSMLLVDFNLLASTMRGNERQMCHELTFLLKEAGDAEAKADKTGIRGLVVAKTALNPVEAIEKLRVILQERPYEFRYSLRIIPIQKVVHTDLEEIRQAAMALSAGIGENETFRVTVEKRFSSLHSRDLIEAAATGIKNKADMDNPDKVLLIEVLSGFTGMSLLKPSDLIAVQKEKML